MSDISPYGVTQNANAEMVTANQMVGDRAGNSLGNALVGSSAAGFSTAPYIPPKRDGCPGKNNTCRAPLVHGTDRCVFHRLRENGESSAAP